MFNATTAITLVDEMIDDLDHASVTQSLLKKLKVRKEKEEDDFPQLSTGFERPRVM